ncbi:MAG TPA: hypothetical protein VK923_18205 [Euzebyales bacterium]|nr:hypothetical protein [Euzebyales bacterium]
MIALAYGPRADWVRDILAPGSAAVEHEGHTIRVQLPELVVGADADQSFRPRKQRAHRLYGVEDFLQLTRT